MSHPTGPTAPTIGRIVHYQPAPHLGIDTAPAIVTAVHDDQKTVTLTIFWPDEAPDYGVVATYSDPTAERAAGTWHWPMVVR